MTIEQELAALFGPETIQRAGRLPTKVSPEQAGKVEKLACVLRTARKPKQQRDLVEALPDCDRVLLCRWLSDRGYAGKCIST